MGDYTCFVAAIKNMNYNFFPRYTVSCFDVLEIENVNFASLVAAFMCSARYLPV